MEEEVIKVFVYGTLKRGEGNHRLLAQGCLFIGDDTIKAKLFDLGHFPAIQQGTDVVQGEVYMVGPNTLRRLDALEGHPNFYKREVVTTLNKKHDVWAYFMPEMVYKARHLPEGVWRRNSPL